MSTAGASLVVVPQGTAFSQESARNSIICRNRVTFFECVQFRIEIVHKNLSWKFMLCAVGA